MRPSLNEILWCYQSFFDPDIHESIREIMPQGVLETLEKEYEYRLLERKLNQIKNQLKKEGS